MGRPTLRLTLLAAALITLVHVPIARAADVQTVITMEPIPNPVYRGAIVLFQGRLTDQAAGTVTIEWSTDNVTWQKLKFASNHHNTYWSEGESIDENVPLGTRYLRAHYEGSPGFLPAYSDVQVQEVLRRQATISNFKVFNPNQNVIVPGTDPVRVFATASDGPMTLERYVNDDWSVIGGPGGGDFWTDVAALGEGDHRFRANIPTTAFHLGAVQELTVHVEKGATEPIWIGDLTVQANHPLPAQVSINGHSGGPSMDGPMTVKDLGSGTEIAAGMVGMQFTIPAMTVGTHRFLVSYLGTSDYAASSKTVDVVVTADAVQATSVTRNYGTFYPVKDGYRDTVTMSGTRLEPLSVLIRIYSPGGSLVKSATLSRASGAYKYAWNGRTSSGALRSAGRYKILQTLTDAAGTRRTFTAYTYISHKKLVTKTTYVTKLGSSISVKGDPGTGSIVISTSGGYAKLAGSYPNGWVGVGYQFSLPSAAVYKAIYFQVYSKGPLSVPTSVIAVQNFVTCPYSSTAAWNESCFDHREGISVSPTTLAWTSTSAHLTRNRHGRVVRGMVSVPAYTHWIYKARVKVVYGVLQ